MSYIENKDQQSCVLVTSHQQKCMLQLNQTNRNAGYCCTGSAGMSVQVLSGQCTCLFYFLPTNRPYLPLCLFDYAALDQHTCLKTSSYVCNSFTRLAGMLQYRCFKRCFEPTDMFVVVASDHLARPLQLNSTGMHVC